MLYTIYPNLPKQQIIKVNHERVNPHQLVQSTVMLLVTRDVTLAVSLLTALCRTLQDPLQSLSQAPHLDMYGGHSLGYKDEDDLMFPMEDDEVIKRTGFMSSECLYCQTDTTKGRFFLIKM